ncbi:hypothetical protein CYMTET_7009 [Cymbomonas tetramitiformis]|uniref:Sialidase domain-containing protein n=1 Tax=Cymbomonas tetramitiformis TaxID=36881 RepID=A0AAE0GVV9_9CHLO|nr:hypothetical protein CYMTET_7009 [Cymbomonas tetramitiformis]
MISGVLSLLLLEDRDFKKQNYSDSIYRRDRHSSFGCNAASQVCFVFTAVMFAMIYLLAPSPNFQPYIEPEVCFHTDCITASEAAEIPLTPPTTSFATPGRNSPPPPPRFPSLPPPKRSTPLKAPPPPAQQKQEQTSPTNEELIPLVASAPAVDGCRYAQISDCRTALDNTIHALGNSGPFMALLNTTKPPSATSTIQLQGDGSLLLAHSTLQLFGQGTLAVSRLPLGQLQWTPFRVLCNLSGTSSASALSAPVLHQDNATGVISLFYVTEDPGGGSRGENATGHVNRRWSADGGRTWSRGAVVSGMRDDSTMPVISGRIVFSLKGEWLMPVCYATDGIPRYCKLWRSGDAGHTWEGGVLLSNPVQALTCPTLVRLPSGANGPVEPIHPPLFPPCFLVQEGTLRAFFRDMSGMAAHVSDSEDDGRTWPDQSTSTGMPNPNTAMQVVQLQKPTHLVAAFNNGQGCGATCPLALGLSVDGGETWAYVRDLDQGGGRGAHYNPTVLQAADRRIHVTYSFRDVGLKHVVIDEGWIRRGSVQGGAPSQGSWMGGRLGISDSVYKKKHRKKRGRRG